MADERSTTYDEELRRQALELERIRVALESADKLEIERIHNSTIVPGAWTPAQVKEYVERILTEREKAVVREQEARNAAVLREQETRDVALRREQETRDTALAREQASRDMTIRREQENLAAMIALGDGNLREHMAQQIEGVRQQVAAATREAEIRAGEAEKAILKQETATERRFESANEWRGQSLDRERSQQDQMTKLSTTFAPREVMEARVEDLTKRIEANTRRLDQSGGQEQGAAEATTARQMSNGATVGIVSALAGVIVAVIIAANAITGG